MVEEHFSDVGERAGPMRRKKRSAKSLESGRD